ncbi:class I SAM-dependent methyltransferase [Thiocapsa rosea]|uniref:Methyltransferase family protein n=1 Tax=Thiocapsa rosea TaxID=69360 RepID=A0A495VE85_9GAMM|nr:class I SAM-dependent methyltransferase [Thiocapsa rosea]RKT47711.1 methyltransferase family protein [Thiocapsa rosea]
MQHVDHFTPVADDYAVFRPRYPEALLAWLADLAPARRCAWDCATGSGQAAVELARHFEHVIATDISEAQLAAAIPHPRILYRRGPAEACGLPDRSVDLVTVAQALHWLDLGRFYAEVRRVLRPDGLLAVWSYGLLETDDAAINGCIREDYHAIIQPFWPDERRHVENGYRSLDFPFPEIQAPAFALTADWTLDALLGYLRSWSATARYRAANGGDPVAAFGTRLAPVWGRPETCRTIRWPLSLRVGRATERRIEGSTLNRASPRSRTSPKPNAT